MATPRKPAPPAKQPAAEQRISRRQPSRDEVEKRAYELWKQRGGEHGSDWDDWLNAEKELQDKH